MDILKSIEQERNFDKLVDYLEHKWWPARAKAAEVIATFFPPNTIAQELSKLASSDKNNTKYWLAKTLSDLGVIGAKLFVQILEEYQVEQLFDIPPSPEIAEEIKKRSNLNHSLITYISKFSEAFKDEEFAQTLISSENQEAVLTGIKILSNFASTKVVYSLFNLTSHESKDIRSAAIEALAKIKNIASLNVSQLIARWYENNFKMAIESPSALAKLDKEILQANTQDLIKTFNSSSGDKKLAILIALAKGEWEGITELLLNSYKEFSYLQLEHMFSELKDYGQTKILSSIAADDRFPLEIRFLASSFVDILPYIDVVEKIIELERYNEPVFKRALLRIMASLKEGLMIIEKLPDDLLLNAIKLNSTLIITSEKVAERIYNMNPELATVSLTAPLYLPKWAANILKRAVTELDLPYAMLALDKLIGTLPLSEVAKLVEKSSSSKELRLWFLNRQAMFGKREVVYEVFLKLLDDDPELAVSTLDKLAEINVSVTPFHLKKLLVSKYAKLKVLEYLQVVHVNGAEELVIELTSSSSPDIVRAAAATLRNYTSKDRVVETLIKLLDHEKWPVRRTAALALTSISPSKLPILYSYLRKSQNTAYWLSFVLGDVSDEADKLISLFDEVDIPTKKMIISSLAKMASRGNKEATDFLLKIKDEFSIVEFIKDLRDERFIPYLKEKLENGKENERIWAAYSLANFHYIPEVVDFLQKFKDDSNFWVKKYVWEALHRASSVAAQL